MVARSRARVLDRQDIDGVCRVLDFEEKSSSLPSLKRTASVAFSTPVSTPIPSPEQEEKFPLPFLVREDLSSTTSPEQEEIDLEDTDDEFDLPDDLQQLTSLCLYVLRRLPHELLSHHRALGDEQEARLFSGGRLDLMNVRTILSVQELIEAYYGRMGLRIGSE